MTDSPTNSAPRPNQPLTIHASEGFAAWLADTRLGLVLTTYQGNRVFFVGRKPDGRLAVTERVFDRPMGLFAHQGHLHLATHYQLWRLENHLRPGETYRDWDRLYVPATAHTTGDLNAHEVVVDRRGRVLFVNTVFSCIAALEPGYSFAPVWQPPFISKLVAEDRCHLNGLALRAGEPAYATACSATDGAAGWRHQRVGGGVVIHIPSNEIIATGLSMPHSPRWHDGKLWLLNSGTGELGHLDGGKFVPVAFCPGFVRGLAFVGRWAVVGLSKLRSTSLGGLPVERRLHAIGQTARCGLHVIDLATGQTAHALDIDGAVEELFDVVLLPDCVRPGALGFRDEEIERLVNFPGSDGLRMIKPTRQDAQGATPLDGPVKYQRVYHLTPENLLPYEALTSPSLKQRWQTRPRRGELVGISAAINGTLVGLAVAEQWLDPASQQVAAEVLSLYVVPTYQQRGIDKGLLGHLQRALGGAVSLAKPT